LANQATLANWNIQTLTYPGDPKTVFPDDYRRTAQDFSDLVKWRDFAAADIFFLQEVTSPAAIDAVFPVTQGWKHCISGQYSKDQGGPAQPICTETGGIAAKPTGDSRTQYTAVAIRTGSAAKIDAVSDVPSLDVRTKTDGQIRSIRWGLDVTVSLGMERLHVLVVHLKTGCFDAALTRREFTEDPAGKEPSGSNCVVLARQLFPLRAWIEARESEASAWMIVGDFNRRFDSGAGSFQDEAWSALSGYAPRPDSSSGALTDSDTRTDIPLFRAPYKEASLCWRELREPFPASLATADDYNILPIEFFLYGNRARPLVSPASGKQVPWPYPVAADMKRLSDHCPKTIRIEAK
jgi:endonuclease/exonuclease/phosphatase family metal-dependent hydrolase